MHTPRSDKTDGLVGTIGWDYLSGLGGADTIEGRAGADKLIGGLGEDFIRGGKGQDYLVGGRNEDDALLGGPGEGCIEADDGFRDYVRCGDGNDIANVTRLDRVRNCEDLN
jgi:Ca2+-binding RTX toxin-like protein